MKRFLFISTLVLISGLVLLWIVLQSSETLGCATPNPEPVCGTYLLYESSESASLGKQVFNTNCAACHKLSRHMTGPALQSVIKPYDSISFTSFVKENKRVVEKQEDFSQHCISFPHLSEDDINNLLVYINAYHY
ncbi:c-type cytochrome [Winogradskyella sp. 3972H.M.0a.05]|uniref:c-type cytochrome n=1 Tax=Winogradskyella sp. 3972H.M.0a.05 TaxID=2950277 RepID=UPI003391754A